ncbi:PTPRS-like protein [Mya arenaria]|uniref:PTPRS-like protein n=1 Tax=Mya arenaria TaxID=6604 RepID=A0ABY7G6I7_MYAAR|nr:PTPRS-like protein [Mya arenaria]
MQTESKVLLLEKRIGNLETEFRNSLEDFKMQLAEGFEHITMTQKTYESKQDEITRNIQRTMANIITKQSESYKSPLDSIRSDVSSLINKYSQAAPCITNAPKNMKVADNRIASGHPAPAFHWERGGKPINSMSRCRYAVFSTPYGTALRVDAAKSTRDNTYFTCVAKNNIGEARAKASLEGYPRIDINPQLKSVEKGQPVTLLCGASAEGMERPNTYWLKDYLPIDLSDPRIRINYNGDGSLTIDSTQERDVGKYECVAENEVRVAYSFPAMVYVKAQEETEIVQPPDHRHGSPFPTDDIALGSAPRNVTALIHSPYTILISWEQPEIRNSVIQGYEVFYTTNPDLPIVLWHKKEVSGDSTMATISGLQPDATYTICVDANYSISRAPLSTPVQKWNPRT